MNTDEKSRSPNSQASLNSPKSSKSFHSKHEETLSKSPSNITIKTRNKSKSSPRSDISNQKWRSKSISKSPRRSTSSKIANKKTRKSYSRSPSPRSRSTTPKKRSKKRYSRSRSIKRRRRSSTQSRSPPAPVMRRGRQGGEPSSFIGVFGLSLRTRESQLREYFGKYGKIDRLELVKNKDTGESRGFCFIDYAEFRAAKKAVNEGNGEDFDGSRMRIEYSIRKFDVNANRRQNNNNYRSNNNNNNYRSTNNRRRSRSRSYGDRRRSRSRSYNNNNRGSNRRSYRRSRS